MKRKYRKPKKNLTFRMISSFEKWYYKLSFGVRHVVGTLLFLLVFAGVFGITYGGYHAFRAGYQWVASVIEHFTDSHEDADEYSDGKSHHFDFPLADNQKHPARRVNYQKDFDFVNDVHLVAAQALGIEPQETRADLEKQRARLVELRDTRYYQILPLTSSSPYLVPRAADFLTALGRLMQEYSGTNSRFLISSVLRTQEDVRGLTRVNRNASTNSTHCYGTTVDITYSRFDVHGNITEAGLKEVLARALYDMQSQGYCYVKYEVKQPCFHITVRP